MMKFRDIVFLMKKEESTLLLEAWHEGVEHYNAGRFWEAHESWERGWVRLAEPERSWVQAWIQIAGAHHLRLKGRLTPSLALVRRAREKLETAAAMRGVVPR